MVYRRFLLIASLFLCILSFVFVNTQISNKINLDINYRIIGGNSANIADYPYTAFYYGCGASILSRYWLLTAAHCGRKQAVIVGSTNFYFGRKYLIRHHITHENFNPRIIPTQSINQNPFDYDFQLLKLWHSLIFTPTVQPIKIGCDRDFMPGKLATATGWGKTNYGMTETLMSVDISMISRDSCNMISVDGFSFHITPRMICVGEKEGNKDTCQGDSGGPLTSNGRLIGVTSFGIGCGRPGIPGVYAYVPSVRNWIYATIGIRPYNCDDDINA